MTWQQQPEGLPSLLSKWESGRNIRPVIALEETSRFGLKEEETYINIGGPWAQQSIEREGGEAHPDRGWQMAIDHRGGGWSLDGLSRRPRVSE